MSSYSDKNIVTLAIELLLDKGLLTKREIESKCHTITRIASDGSTRRFWRIDVGDKPLFIVAAPLMTSEAEKMESRSAWYIGNHLHQKGCSVPEVYVWHEDSGLLVFEDLGNDRLHGVVVNPQKSSIDISLIKQHYHAVIHNLVHMQVEGAVDFDPDWCWDGGQYNKEVMLERESGYFLRAFWSDLLQESTPEGVLLEFQQLADLAVKAPASYFLHRDFQSRNIMVQEGKPTFIDFQGGRLGPLGYDLASLLIDPYSDLHPFLQDEFEDVYTSKLSQHFDFDTTLFHKEFQVLALQRNLQIIGAFSFLSRVRKKSFFDGYLKPALQLAKVRLEEPLFEDFSIMKSMIDSGLKRI